MMKVHKAFFTTREEVFDDLMKELIYHLGCAFEKMGQAENAIEEFKKIYEVDIEYRDVSDKVDAFYQQASE